MNRLLLTVCAIWCAAALVAADQPEAATIERTDNGVALQVRVLSETLDEVHYLLGEGDGAAESSMSRGKIKRVVYGSIADIDYNKAVGARNKNDYEKAAAQFIATTTGTPYPRVRELAFVEAAECFLLAGKHDEALKALASLEAKAPRSVHQLRALALKSRVLVAKGDEAGACQAVDALAKLAPIRGAVAKAELLRAAKKPAEAAAALQVIWGKALTAETTPDASDAPQFGAVGFLLAQDLTAAGDAAAACVVYGKVCYAPLPKEEQARAHLLLAQLLMQGQPAKAKLIEAIDHAFMAAVLGQASRPAAKKTINEILVVFDRDAAMKAEVTEYRSYLNQL